MSHDGFSLYKGVKHVFYTYTSTLNYTVNQYIQFFILVTSLQLLASIVLGSLY